jgi:hypothetical protein
MLWSIQCWSYFRTLTLVSPLLYIGITSAGNYLSGDTVITEPTNKSWRHFSDVIDPSISDSCNSNTCCSFSILSYFWYLRMVRYTFTRYTQINTNSKHILMGRYSYSRTMQVSIPTCFADYLEQTSTECDAEWEYPIALAPATCRMVW